MTMEATTAAIMAAVAEDTTAQVPRLLPTLTHLQDMEAQLVDEIGFLSPVVMGVPGGSLSFFSDPIFLLFCLINISLF